MSHCVDVHHHVMPPSYVKARRDSIAEVMPTMPHALDWVPQHSIEAMDKAGVKTVILSVSAPGVWFGDDTEGRRLARECNEFQARLRADHPGRFGFFAALPLPDIEGSLAEASYALDTLKADGIGLMTSYRNRSLGDPAFIPVYEELNRRKAVIYVHPTYADCARGLVPGVAPAVVEFMFDVTRTIVSLLFGGVFTRFPEIRFIFTHGGGALPMLAGRIGGGLGQRLGTDAGTIFRRLFYDTASITNPLSFNAARQMAGLSQILFGTDFPFGDMQRSMDGLRGLNLSADDLRAVEGFNALQLLPQFAASAARVD